MKTPFSVPLGRVRAMSSIAPLGPVFLHVGIVIMKKTVLTALTNLPLVSFLSQHAPVIISSVTITGASQRCGSVMVIMTVET